MLVMTYGSGPDSPVSDFRVEELYEILACIPDDVSIKVKYSTVNIFDRVRLGIVKNEIDHWQVIFVWDGRHIAINEFGAIPHWPKGFLDQAEFSGDILRAALTKRRKV